MPGRVATALSLKNITACALFIHTAPLILKILIYAKAVNNYLRTATDCKYLFKKRIH